MAGLNVVGDALGKLFEVFSGACGTFSLERDVLCIIPEIRGKLRAPLSGKEL